MKNIAKPTVFLSIFFPLGTFKNSGEAFKFFIDDIPFVPKTILSHHSFGRGLKYEKFEFEKTLELLTLNNDIYFHIADKKYHWNDEKYLYKFIKILAQNVECFYFSIEPVDYEWAKRIVKKANQLNLSNAVWNDPYKARFQSYIFIDNFKYEGRLYDKYTTVWSDSLGEIIDISKNPGHQRLTFEMSLMAAPIMWFGKNAFRYFSFEKLMSFPLAHKIEEVDKDLVYIELFDPFIEDYETEEILELQKQFRAWTNMDDVELILEEEVKKNGKRIESRYEKGDVEWWKWQH